jgi:hypothetical protein
MAGINEYFLSLPTGIPAGFYTIITESNGFKVFGKMIKL